MHDALIMAFCFALCALVMAIVQRIALSAPVPPALKGSPKHKAGSRAGDLLACLAGIQLCAMFLLLTARPIAACLLCLGTGMLLLTLNRAKERVLHEPLVLVDAYLLPQVFRYPELYLPFLPVRRILLFLLPLGCALVGLLILEPPLRLARSFTGAALCAGLFLLPICAAFVVNRGGVPRFAACLLRLCPVSHDAVADAMKNGPLASALMHPVLAGSLKNMGLGFLNNPMLRPVESRWPEYFARALPGLENPAPEIPPHVLLIQAESFFDIRPMLPAGQRAALSAFLPNWEALQAAGRTLPTPEKAFGAYTMRTEFAVLTGLEATSLGPWAFNPYILAAKKPLWSLARHFENLGYTSLCLHPYYGDFFNRDKVMRNLGFRRFMHLDELRHLAAFGPYASDAALGEEIQAILSKADKPVFCFAITMEAHGPWLEKRLSDQEIAEVLHDLDYRLFSRELQIYLCHLRNMDRLFGRLNHMSLSKHSNSAGCQLWVYGDHPPSLRL